jgi:hypothetical protein
MRSQSEIKAGQIYRDNVRDSAAARRAFERAVEFDPLSTVAIGELQEFLQRLGDESARRTLLQKSLSVMQLALADRPLQPDIWRALCRIGEWSGASESRYAAAELAVFFNVAQPSDEEFFVQRRSARLAEPSRSLSPEGRERLWAAELNGPWREALALLSEALQKVAGPEVATFGIGRAERVLNRPGSTWGFLFRVAEALGVPLAEIYVASTNAELCVPVGVDPGVLVVGTQLEGKPPPRARYRLGRALAYLAHRAAPLLSATEDEARQLLAAGAQAAGVPLPPALAGAVQGERVRRLDRALGRRERKQLAQLVPRLSAEPNPTAFVRALGASAARTGLLFAGELAAALEEARPGLAPAGTRRFKTTDDLVADFEGYPDALAVLRLAASQDLIALRRELGWA